MKDSTNNNSGIKAWMLLAFTLTILGSDFVISKDIIEYALGSIKLAGWIIAPAISIFTALMPRFLAIAFSRGSKKVIFVAVLVSLALFAFMFIGQIELGRGVFGTCLILILFIASTIFHIEYDNQQKASADSRRIKWIKERLPLMKVKIKSLEEEADQERKSITVIARDKVDGLKKDAKERILTNTKKRDGLSRELKSEAERLSELSPQINSKIQEAYAAFK